MAGLASAGVDVLRLGVIPTPGVAYLTEALGADFGVVISASHNPARDNGIKFFGRGGVKLPDATEDDIEAQLKRGQARRAADRRGSAGSATPAREHERYLDHLLATLPDQPQPPLAGLRVVADCAHGAAYLVAPRALRRAGAEVITIGAEPDGLNINEGCGSTALGALCAAVVEHGADAGIAYDGDADRCLAVDADGQPLDGDQILTVLATGMKEAGRLARRRGGGHGDVEPGLPRGDARRRHRGDRDAGGRQARVRGHAGRRLRARRRAVRAHHHARARHHRRRRADQPAVAGRGEPARRAAGRGRQDDAEVPAGARQRARRRVAARPRRSTRRSAGPKPSWAATGGSWSGRAAPSPRSG